MTIATYFDVKLPILASKSPLQAVYYVFLTSLPSMSIELLFSTKILGKIIQKRSGDLCDYVSSVFFVFHEHWCEDGI